jgi:molybdenum cofactor cytidylyltransferase
VILEAVILAAGKSQRFGGIKQLAVINGWPMLEHCHSTYYQCETLLAGIVQLSVVLGANESLIKDQLSPHITVFSATHWEDGMGSSLADYIKQIGPNTSHVLISLADQVALQSSDLAKLIAQHQQNPDAIVCAKYNDVEGAPVIFPRQYFAELANLKGEQGAKSLLKRHIQNVIIVDMPNAQFDIDTQQDLQQALDSLKA